MATKPVLGKIAAFAGAAAYGAFLTGIGEVVINSVSGSWYAGKLS